MMRIKSFRVFSRALSHHKQSAEEVFAALDINTNETIPGVFDGSEWKASGSVNENVNPSTGKAMATIQYGSKEDMVRCIENAHEAKKHWASLPAPKRGDIIRQLGDKLRMKKDSLGHLISLEMGKIITEGEGEVQEYIDICDFALGLSRTLQGQYLPSERQDHSLLEVYNPLGTTGIITAFNFPNAVSGWNTAINLVCGNTQIIKGSESASLVNIATQKLLIETLKENDIDTRVATLCQGFGHEVGDALISSKKVDMVSFTGSTETGRHVQNVVGSRFGKTLLELGGNNAIIISENCDEKLLENALRSVLFAAVGTCGQRCTSLRRLLVHEKHYDTFKARLKQSYDNINDLKNNKIGDPTKSTTLVGPLHTVTQYETFQAKLKEAKGQNGTILSGGDVVSKENLPDDIKDGLFVHPTLVEIEHNCSLVFEENFMPILYLTKISSLEEGIELNNVVDQGLSSSVFTNRMEDVFTWIGPNGSDTGIVNVNTGCSGAEIGGAFGGNKHTGWGRESGSDAWKQYMRRATCTINYGDQMPLAQGVDFSA